MNKQRIVVLGVLGAALLAAGTAMATPVIVKYTGTILTHSASISDWGGIDPLAGVTTFSGTWNYDTNASKSSEDELKAIYTEVSGVMNVGMLTYNFPDARLGVYKNETGMLFFDGAGYLGGYTSDYFMALHDSSVAFDKMPPATLDLAWFTDSYVYFELSLPRLVFGGRLTYLHSVPEPTTMLLLGLGLVGLAGIRRRMPK